MSYPPPFKRLRPDASTPTSTSAEHPQLAELNHALTTIPPPQLTQILQSVLPHHPHALSEFLAQHQAYLSHLETARRKAPPKDFDYLSKSVWKELNITHRRLRPSQQFEVIGDIQEVIEDAIKTIIRGCNAMVEILNGMDEREMGRLEETETIGGIRWLNEEYGRYAVDVFVAVMDILDGDDNDDVEEEEEEEEEGEEEED